MIKICFVFLKNKKITLDSWDIKNFCYECLQFLDSLFSFEWKERNTTKTIYYPCQKLKKAIKNKNNITSEFQSFKPFISN